MENQYDLVIIGAGPGGYTAAIRAAQSGLRTALIEKEQVGGTCLNRGCIPTKTLMHASHLYREITAGEALGISVKECSYDIVKMYQRKSEVTEQLRTGVEFLLNANKVDLIKGTARITGSRTVEVSGSGTGAMIPLSADHILLATGSVPALPHVPGIGLPGVFTSDGLLEQEGTDYRSLVIIGGGVIGVEFATIFAALGCQVTIVEAMDRLLPGMDKEISQNLGMILKKRGISVYTGAMVEKLKQDGDILTCCLTHKGKELSVEAEAILAATGRRANVDGLFSGGNDAAAELKMDRGIIVDENFESSIPGLYAVGDVIHGGIQLAHAAAAQACNVIAHICGKTPVVDLNTVPSCIYTDPEIASVGLDAAAAKELGIETRTGKYSMAGNAKSMIENQDRGFIKLLFEADSEVLLGAQLMCARATDLVSELSTAIVNRLTVTQLAAVIRPHPTFTEGVTEAVEDAVGEAIHIAPKRR